MAETDESTSHLAATTPEPAAVPASGNRRPTNGKRPRRRGWRFIRWTAIVFLILLILIIVAVQIVLSTSLPKRIVLEQIEKELGLRATASSLSTGWFGRTTLRDVKLSLPLADNSVLDVPEMNVHTNWLVGIIFGGAKIKGLELQHPTINVWQDSAGQWNVAEVIELLGRTGGAKPVATAAQQQKTAPTQARPDLPTIAINDATIVITNAQLRQGTIEHLTITGRPEGVLVWHYSISVPDHLQLEGKLAPGGVWQHEATIAVDRPEVWLKPWMTDAAMAGIPDIHFDARWNGELQDGQPKGRLALSKVGVGATTVTGAVAVNNEAGVWVARPEKVLVQQQPSTQPAAQQTADASPATPGPGHPPRPPSTSPAAISADAEVTKVGLSPQAGGATTREDISSTQVATMPATLPVNSAVVLRPVTIPTTTPAFAFAATRAAGPASQPATEPAKPTTTTNTTSPTQLAGTQSATTTTTIPTTQLAMTRPATAPTAHAPPGLSLSAVSGRLTFDGRAVRAESLRLIGAGGFAQLDAQYTLAARAGNADVVWSEIALPQVIRHNGQLHAILTTRLDGGPELRATLATSGNLGATPRGWEGNLTLNAAGRGWDDMAISLNAPQLLIKGRDPIVLDGLSAALRVQDQDVTLKSVMLAGASAPTGAPGGGSAAAAAQAGTASLASGTTATARPRTLGGDGHYLIGTGEWAILLDGQGWPVRQLAGEPLDFHIDAAGSPQHTTLRDITLSASELVLKLTGDYDMHRPKPVAVGASLTRQPPPPTLRVIQEARVAQAGQPQAPPLITGSLIGKATITGDISPIALTIDGTLVGHDLGIHGKRVGTDGELNVHIEGGANDDLAQLHTHIDLLGGQWDLRAGYVFETDASTVELAVHDLPLDQVASMAGQEGVTGVLRDGKWVLYVPGLKADFRDMRLTGGLLLERVASAPLLADTVRIGTTLDGGRFIVDPIEARSGADGVFRATVADDLAQWRHIEVTDVALIKWPLNMSGVILTANGGSRRIGIDLPDVQAKDEAAHKTRTNTTAVWFDTDVALERAPGANPLPIGTASMTLGMEGRIMDVRRVYASVLGAEAFGYSVIDFDHPLLAAGDLRFDHLEANRLALAFPEATALQSLRGTYSATARLFPARAGEVVDALEPLVLDVNLNASPGAGYGVAEIGNGRFRAFLNLDTQWGFLRGVLADSDVPNIPPSQQPGYPPCNEPRTDPPPANAMYVAGGVMRVWGRAMRVNDVKDRPGSSSIATHGRVSFKCIQLDQLVHAFNPKSPPTPGLINGQVLLWGATSLHAPTVKRPPAATVAAAEANAKAAGEPGRAPAPTTGPVIEAATAPTTGPFARPRAVATTIPAEVAATQPPLALGNRPPAAPTTAPAAPPQQRAGLVERLLASLYGEGAIDLHQSDLGNVDVVAALFNIMHLGAGGGAPTGSGDVRFRIEQGTLNITRMHYFNRGVEVRALGTVSDLPHAPKSPIDMTAFGSVRPLKNIELPLLPDVDKLLSVIQTGAASVKVGGTVEKRDIRVVPFSELGQGMREFLMGDISASVQNSAGQ